jgi:hypothetical protein
MPGASTGVAGAGAGAVVVDGGVGASVVVEGIPGPAGTVDGDGTPRVTGGPVGFGAAEPVTASASIEVVLEDGAEVAAELGGAVFVAAAEAEALEPGSGAASTTRSTPAEAPSGSPDSETVVACCWQPTATTINATDRGRSHDRTPTIRTRDLRRFAVRS